MGEMIGWRHLNGTPRGPQPLLQGIRVKIESLRVVLDAQQRQHGPGIAGSRRLAYRRFQCGARSGEIFAGEPLEVAETAQHRLVGAELSGISAAHNLAHAPSAATNGLATGPFVSYVSRDTANSEGFIGLHM